jgi:hypothetical protein
VRGDRDAAWNAGDDVGRERLCRYGARPALSLERLRRLPAGRFAYRVKYARRGRAKHRVMTSTVSAVVSIRANLDV